MIEKVTGAVWNDGRAMTACLASITRWAPCSRKHSGQRWPTEASIEHAGQIGRSQWLHESPVGRSGCR
jgi:hypothetical protein